MRSRRPLYKFNVVQDRFRHSIPKTLGIGISTVPISRFPKTTATDAHRLLFNSMDSINIAVIGTGTA
jgi:hypothetical protein